MRRHPEYWVQCWALQDKTDTDVLLRVQQRAMEMTKGLEQVSMRKG